MTTKQSEPRTDSCRETEISPSLKVLTSDLPSGSPSDSAICLATGRLELCSENFDILAVKIHDSDSPAYFFAAPLPLKMRRLSFKAAA